MGADIRVPCDEGSFKNVRMGRYDPVEGIPGPAQRQRFSNCKGKPRIIYNRTVNSLKVFHYFSSGESQSANFLQKLKLQKHHGRNEKLISLIKGLKSPLRQVPLFSQMNKNNRIGVKKDLQDSAPPSTPRES